MGHRLTNPLNADTDLWSLFSRILCCSMVSFLAQLLGASLAKKALVYAVARFYGCVEYIGPLRAFVCLSVCLTGIRIPRSYRRIAQLNQRGSRIYGPWVQTRVRGP